VKFEQPLFQPNYLKNNIEEAELSLEREELDYIGDIVRLIDDITDDYYDLFELSYKDVICSNHLANLQQVSEIVNNNSQQDTARSIERIQVQVELANTQEQLLENQSDMRLEATRIKQNLIIDAQDSLIVKPLVKITPVTVDIDQAIQYGYTLRPTLRLHDINRRRDEINLQETKSRGAFHINLEMTYGMEKQDERYQELWDDKDNSYSVSINAYIPIWDWGRRKANTEASKISIRRTELRTEESINGIESEITNAAANLEEYQKRALNMKENMDVAQKLSTASITQFEKNQISIQDILKILERQKETELNFLDAYLGYRKSLVSLMVNTHYDFENDISLIDKFHAM